MGWFPSAAGAGFMIASGGLQAKLAVEEAEWESRGYVDQAKASMYDANVAHMEAELLLDEMKFGILAAQQQENARLKKLDQLQSKNLAMVNYDPWESASFMAVKESNETDAEMDVRNIWIGALQEAKVRNMQFQLKMDEADQAVVASERFMQAADKAIDFGNYRAGISMLTAIGQGLGNISF